MNLQNAFAVSTLGRYSLLLKVGECGSGKSNGSMGQRSRLQQQKEGEMGCPI